MSSISADDFEDESAAKSEYQKPSGLPPPTHGSSNDLSDLDLEDDEMMLLMDIVLRPNREEAEKNEHSRNQDAARGDSCRSEILSEHNYHDHIGDPIVDIVMTSHRRGTKEPFPHGLHKLLNDMATLGMEHIASWLPHGRAFAVYDHDCFEQHIISKYFHQTKMSSFLRQLYAYGFVRMVNPGPDKGSYYHESFLRGRVDLCGNMTRKQTGHEHTHSHTRKCFELEPDFYAMRPATLNNDGGGAEREVIRSDRFMVGKQLIDPIKESSAEVVPLLDILQQKRQSEADTGHSDESRRLAKQARKAEDSARSYPRGDVVLGGVLMASSSNVGILPPPQLSTSQFGTVMVTESDQEGQIYRLDEFEPTPLPRHFNCMPIALVQLPIVERTANTPCMYPPAEQEGLEKRI